MMKRRFRVTRKDLIEAGPIDFEGECLKANEKRGFEKWLDVLRQHIEAEKHLRSIHHSLKNLRKDLSQSSVRDYVVLWQRLAQLHEKLEIALFREQDTGTPLERYYGRTDDEQDG